jgi:pimeloyl-ACP methyl ester carboxylesterase
MRKAIPVAIALAVATAVGGGVRPAQAHPCVKANELWFRTADGVQLVGHRFGGKRPGTRTALVLAHMSGGDLCQWAPYARRLAARGFFVFPFDFRGHGFSKGRPTYGRLGLDVAAAVRAVRGLGARKVVVAGASLGGIAAVVAAANVRPLVDGVVAVSAPATIDGQLSATPSAPRIRIPTLYIAAEQDQNAPYDFAADARKLHDATGTTEKRLELVSGSAHGTFLVNGSAQVRALLETFLRDPAASVP